MSNVTTVIIIESEIVNESKLEDLNMLVKPGEEMPLRLNGEVDYRFESENGEEIKIFWSL